MTPRNSPRVALVTGAAAGLGKAFAERLAQDGNDLILVDVCDTDITAELVQQHGCTALQVRCDVTDEAQVTDLVATARARFESVDILVSNAGIYPKADIADLTLAEWKRVFAVNVEGAFLITRAFLPPMRQRGWGRIVYLASVSFHAGSPCFPHYVASKGALIGLMHSLATEASEDGVTINALAPSIVLTEGTRRDAIPRTRR